MRYRPEIDVLRAIAVIPVIFFHAGVQLFSGGFVGVDIFFVISGYLITTIILADLEAGQFSLLTFYERRARRILPALYVVMASCLPFAWLWLMPSDAKEFSNSVMAVLVFASNMFFWQSSNYFDAGSDLKPLLHTWSLGVEEQFYVLFPILSDVGLEIRTKEDCRTSDNRGAPQLGVSGVCDQRKTRSGVFSVANPRMGIGYGFSDRVLPGRKGA
jgi:peptidoglycan/LPS O-acetylase OafA/YrhL